MLSMAVGMTVSSAGASGEHTSAVLTSPLTGSSTTFTWSYEFHDNGGHGLSNIAISFCSTDILPRVVSATPAGEAFPDGDVPGGHTGFGPGVKFATTAVSGTLTVVFDQPYPAGGTVNVQSHSGDGQAGDLVTIAGGPGSCGAPTTTTTVATTTSTIGATTTSTALQATTTSTVLSATTTSTALATTTSTVPATTTSTAPASTTSTVVRTTTTSPGITTTTQPPAATAAQATTSTSVPTSVLGARFTADDPAANLAKTGFNGGPLLAFGMVTLVLGMALLVGDRLQGEA